MAVNCHLLGPGCYWELKKLSVASIVNPPIRSIIGSSLLRIPLTTR